MPNPACNHAVLFDYIHYTLLIGTLQYILILYRFCIRTLYSVQLKVFDYMHKTVHTHTVFRFCTCTVYRCWYLTEYIKYCTVIYSFFTCTVYRCWYLTEYIKYCTVHTRTVGILYVYNVHIINS